MNSFLKRYTVFAFAALLSRNRYDHYAQSGNLIETSPVARHHRIGCRSERNKRD